MKTYLIPVTNSYEYDYCNYVIVKSETPSDAYHRLYTKRLRFNSWSFLFCNFSSLPPSINTSQKISRKIKNI